MFEAQLENFNEEEYRQLESLNELFEFIDSILSDEEEEEPPRKKLRAECVGFWSR